MICGKSCFSLALVYHYIMKIVLPFIVLLFSFNVRAQFDLTVEAGASWQARNDVRIPNDAIGDKFDFSEFDEGPFFHHRFEVLANIKGRHNIRVVYAPLSLSVDGGFDQNTTFNDVTFNNTDDVTVNYQFNSYRIGYVYNWVNKSKHKLNVGLTLKVRDADIRVTQNNTSDNYDNLGLVPLLYFSYQYNFNDTLNLYTDADFAAASQGRAFDFAVKLRKELSERYSLGIGYRLLEGGADNDEVFTFSLFHYAVLDFLVRF